MDTPLKWLLLLYGIFVISCVTTEEEHEKQVNLFQQVQEKNYGVFYPKPSYPTGNINNSPRKVGK